MSRSRNPVLRAVFVQLYRLKQQAYQFGQKKGGLSTAVGTQIVVSKSFPEQIHAHVRPQENQRQRTSNVTHSNYFYYFMARNR